jgi:hypothetical protein
MTSHHEPIPSPDADRPTPRSSAEWVAYFRDNAARLLAVPWDSGAGLTADERALVAESLPTWQLGESSDGARLLAVAQAHADATGDPAFVEVIRLFIGEEQRHAADLGRFLDRAGIPRKTRQWGDAVFRALRHLMNRLEVAARVLLVVEVHALLYYAAVRRATGSAVLRAACRQILRDEVAHVRFQCELLALLQRGRPRGVRALAEGLHRVLFAGTTLVIWAGHRRALRAGGFRFRTFWRSAWAKMGAAWRRTDPTAYHWPVRLPVYASV